MRWCGTIFSEREQGLEPYVRVGVQLFHRSHPKNMKWRSTVSRWRAGARLHCHRHSISTATRRGSHRWHPCRTVFSMSSSSIILDSGRSTDDEQLFSGSTCTVPVARGMRTARQVRIRRSVKDGATWMETPYGYRKISTFP